MNEKDRRAALLQAGAVLFADVPADALSMTEIAARVGCSKALLYHYFGGRRGYYVAVLESIALELVAAIAPEPGPSFEEAFEGSLRRYLGFVQHRTRDFRLVVEAGLGVDPESQGVLQRTRDAALLFLRERLEIRKTVPLVEVALTGWARFAEAAALAWAGEKEVPADQVLALLIEALHPVRRAMALSGLALPADDRFSDEPLSGERPVDPPTVEQEADDATSAH